LNDAVIPYVTVLPAHADNIVVANVPGAVSYLDFLEFLFLLSSLLLPIASSVLLILQGFCIPAAGFPAVAMLLASCCCCFSTIAVFLMLLVFLLLFRLSYYSP
jgi:hypothetical protein